MDLSRVQVNCDAKCFATCTPKKDNRRPNLGWLSVSMLILVYCTMLSFFMFFAIPAHSIFLSLTRNSDPLYLFFLFFAIPNHSIYFFFILQFRSTPFFLQFRPTPFFCNSNPLHLFLIISQFWPIPSFSYFFANPTHPIFSYFLQFRPTLFCCCFFCCNSKPLHLFFFILQFRPTPFFVFLQFRPTPSFSCFYGSSPSVFSAALVLSETQIALQIIDVHSKHCQLHNKP